MIRCSGVALALLVATAAAGVAQPREVLDFEELPPKCVASSTFGDFGSGPIGIRGTSKLLGTRINAAVVVDTAHPDADPDLATRSYHNALIISRYPPTRPKGADAAWVAGSVKTIDDDSTPGGALSFDFSETGPVTFYGLTLIDHDDETASVRIFRTPGAGALLGSAPPGSRLDLTWGRKRWLRLNWFSPVRREARLTLPSDEQSEPHVRLQIAPVPLSGKVTPIDVQELRPRGREARSLAGGRGPLLSGGIPDVTRVEVVLGGSSAVDRIAFRRQGAVTPSLDEDLFTKIQGYLTRELEPKLEIERTWFFASWQRLVDNPTPTLRSDLDNLILELERRLLGVPDEDGVRTRGLLQCPDLECGCPQLRALQAWVEARVERIRTQLATSPDAEPTTQIAARPRVQLAALEPAAYLAAAQDGGGIELALSDAGVDCAGTFWEQFFCEGRVLLAGVSSTLASLVPARVPFDGPTVTIAGASVACDAFRVAPKSREFNHVETGILPGTSRSIPRGLYCVYCRTAAGPQPYATLDLVADPDARPAPVGDEAERCVLGS